MSSRHDLQHTSNRHVVYRNLSITKIGMCISELNLSLTGSQHVIPVARENVEFYTLIKIYLYKCNIILQIYSYISRTNDTNYY